MTETLFPFAEYWWFYAAFTGFVLLMLALDLGVFHRHAHRVSFREAAINLLIHQDFGEISAGRPFAGDPRF